MTLTILETSDVHGHVFPIHYANNQPAEIGMAKIATLIRRERCRNPHTLVIDNGDLLQGTPLTYYHARINADAPNPMVLVLNALAYDAAVLGNHEFNYGRNILDQAVREAQFPWLSANVVDQKTHAPVYGNAYLIKEYPEGLRVGILGLTTQYIPHWEHPDHIRGMVFQDAVACARKWVPFLREEEGADIVVVAYHGGFERNLDSGEAEEELTGENQGYELCTEVEGIDVLLTGHQHRTIVHNVHGVLAVQPGYNGQTLAKVTLELEKGAQGWQICKKKGELLSLHGVEPDERILQLLQPYEEKTQRWLDTPIGRIRGDMRIDDVMEVRIREHPLIEFINRVQMEYGKTDISCTSLFTDEAKGFSTHVTMREIVSNYIYPNTLRVIRLTGQNIKDALEKSASYFAPYAGGEITINPAFIKPKPQPYNYDMWEGIEYKINISRPLGQRVVELKYKGRPLEMDKEYDVVMNNYRAGGGGNFPMFQGKSVVRDIPTDVAELIANYILERGTVEATVNHNWEVIHD